MNVDLDAIAQRGHCEVSSLRLALPLIEQGYTPPFLARYRRDELGGLDEPSLWALSHAVRSEQRLEKYRDDLHTAWQATRLADPAIGRAISGSKSRRLLDRLSRRVKSEANESGSLAQRLAVRLLSPEKGDCDDLETIAAALVQKNPTPASETPVASENGETATDPVGEASSADDPSAAIAKLDDALAKRLSGDPRIMGAAVRWLSRQAKIHILEVTDPHGSEDEGEESVEAVKPSKKAKRKRKSKSAAADQTAAAVESTATPETLASEPAALADEAAPNEPSSTETVSAETASTEPVASETTASETTASEATASEATASEATASEPVAESAEHLQTVEPQPAEATGQPVAEATPTATTVEVAENAVAPAVDASTAETTGADAPVAEATVTTAVTPVVEKATTTEKQAAPAKPAKKKKVSPRQRRRRWLVSTLKPLAGKRMLASKLSAFQIVMLGRALRSQVAQCAFDYDAAQLVAEMQKAAAGLNRHFGDHLAGIVLSHEAALRDAAEGAWWEEIQEQASARLVSIAADNLHRQINRGGVSAKVVMSIDAIGPRTAATSIVAADGRILHNEDIPCQLSAAMRTLAVTKMGELIHQYHVDLIVISNGPARRACMIAIGELIKQSAEKSVRWTLADRSGADAYAGSAAGDQEMRSTPRRFRSAAWIAFSTLQPSQAMVKVDPLKLRLGSFQRELSDDAVLDALEDVLISGAARGGVDVNSTTASWLERLPGMTREAAEMIDAQRRQKLISSREDLVARTEWPSPVHSRQALPFLRVFDSTETLDGTLIHPEDYPLAKRLAKALEIELPPASPPGYVLPDYSASPLPAADESVAASTSAADESEELAEENTAFGPSDEAVEETPAAASATEEAIAEVTTAAETASSDQSSSADEPAVAEESAATDTSDETASPESTDASEPVASAAAGPIIPEPFRQPKPERAKVDKLIKEWQVGVRRSQQIVSWLCEPFGEGSVGGPPPAVMTSMPGLSDLKEGDQVIGVVVGVMPFGVFVELTPECSGLVHVSRVSDGFVEDLHEAVQVGDVVTAWVTGIDGKRRRVGLSAISPEQEAAMQSRQHETRDRGRGGQRGNARGGGQGDTRGRSGEQASAETRGASSTPATGRAGQDARGGGQAARGGQDTRTGQGDRGGQDARSGQGARGGQADRAKSGGDGGARRDNRGGGGGGRDGNRGRSVGGGGGRRDQQSGGGRGPRRPEVYEVVGKEPESAPLTEAMQKGKEPLRSFGDLMQLFSGDKPKPAEPKPVAAKPAPAVKPPTESTVEPTATESPTTAPEKVASHATAEVGAEVASSGGSETTEDAS